MLHAAVYSSTPASDKLIAISVKDMNEEVVVLCLCHVGVYGCDRIGCARHVASITVCVVLRMDL
jgi:hypothetical protein